jgi:hypothetical protein
MDEIFQNILKLNILFVHKLSWSNAHTHPFMNIIVGEVLEQCQHRWKSNCENLHTKNFQIDNFTFMLNFVHPASPPPPPLVPKVFWNIIAQYIIHESDCE